MAAHRKPRATRLKNRPKRPDAATNARPRKVLVTTAAKSRLLRTAPLDLRSRMGKSYMAMRNQLAVHIGGDPSAAQARLIEHAARLAVIGELAWREVAALVTTDPAAALRSPAVDVFTKTAAQEREVLRLLGLERKARPIPNLSEYIAAAARQTADAEPEPDEPPESTDENNATEP